MQRITSAGNESIKVVKQLSKYSRDRQRDGKTVLEGVHLCGVYASKGLNPDLIIVSDTGLQNIETQAVLKKLNDDGHLTGSTVINVPDSLLESISSIGGGAGIIFVINTPNSTFALDDVSDALVLDGVQDPGNVGTLIRTAVASGVKNIFLSQNCASAWSPKTLRAGMGSHFYANIYENENIVNLLKQFKNHQILATSLSAESSVYEVNLAKPTIWVFGSEGAGVSDSVVELCTQTVIIPQEAEVESLNVAASAAVCLFEQRRQRSLRV